MCWRMASADPSAIDIHNRLSTPGSAFDELVETVWRPGSVAVSVELRNEPTDGAPRLSAWLSICSLGPAGSTGEEAAALASVAEAQLRQPGFSFGLERVDPRSFLNGMSGVHTALIRQRMAGMELTDGRSVDVLSRFNPTCEPWSTVARLLLHRERPTAIRATVLPTKLSPADRLELAEATGTAYDWRNSSKRPDDLLVLDRAVQTLHDLLVSFSSPLLVSEIAVIGSDRLPVAFLRSIGSAFTSELDVLRHPGHAIVAGQMRVLGGFDLELDPRGLADALLLGLPLRGGLGERGLQDLVTLTESPIGWPAPVVGPVPWLSASD